jgi:hypothetical protein
MHARPTNILRRFLRFIHTIHEIAGEDLVLMRSIVKYSNRILATAVAFTAAFSPASAIAQDEHGCFDTSNSCVSVSSRWSGDTLVASYTNNCGDRIFARYCSERPSGNHDCGAGRYAQKLVTAVIRRRFQVA